MDRIRYLISAPSQGHDAGLVELYPFRTALSCEDGVIHADLHSHAQRRLRFDLSAYAADYDDGSGACAQAPELMLRPNVVELFPGASQRLRIGLRLGALHVERVYQIVMREVPHQRRDAPLVALRIAMPLIVTPVRLRDQLRAA